MHTVKLPLSEESLKLPARIVEARIMSNQEFMEEHGSGTLRDNKALGFVWSIQCLAERVAYTFGYGFCAVKAHQIVFNDSISECDEQAYTSSGRWFKAYQAKKLFPEDYFEIKYAIIRDDNGQKQWEGIAIIVRETSASFIPENIMVLAKVCRFNPTSHTWDRPVNFA